MEVGPLLQTLRQQEEFRDALAGAVVLGGTGGDPSPDSNGAICRGYVFVTSASGVPKAEILAWMKTNVSKPFAVQFVRSSV